MGYYVKINNETTKKYEAVDKNSFKNFLDFAKGLKFQRLNFVDGDTCKETYYDTPGHLLNRSGIILSRFEEGSNVFFKVETATSLSKVLNKLDKEVFVHKVGYGDKLSDHAFYIKDGITALYSTPFSVDLENIINNCVPHMEVTINAQVYELVSGTGMRARVALENKAVKNFETKRTYKVQSITAKLETKPELYLDDFTEFNNMIEKNCKNLIPIDEKQFDWAINVTKPIIVEKKKKEKKKEVKF
ncbi:MAG: hypothetical protein E7376_05045 [Clostridiales bacterium]|nr:hypothetical protein [Clostridiales bacterium]